MAVKLIGSISKYMGLAADTKPTSVPIGSTFVDYDTRDIWITYDGTNWDKYKRNSDIDRTADIKGTYKPNETQSYMGG